MIVEATVVPWTASVSNSSSRRSALMKLLFPALNSPITAIVTQGSCCLASTRPMACSTSERASSGRALRARRPFAKATCPSMSASSERIFVLVSHEEAAGGVPPDASSAPNLSTLSPVVMMPRAPEVFDLPHREESPRYPHAESQAGQDVPRGSPPLRGERR